MTPSGLCHAKYAVKILVASLALFANPFRQPHGSCAENNGTVVLPVQDSCEQLLASGWPCDASNVANFKLYANEQQNGVRVRIHKY